MSDQSIWKMLHLLNLYARGRGTVTRSLSEAELRAAGIDCFSDTIDPAFTSGAVERSTDGHYSLSHAASLILRSCTVGNKRLQNSSEFRVDHPSVFVIMPFSEAWSANVWDTLIKPAVEKAGLECIRGDMPVRVGELTGTVWNAIISAGLILADLSSPNVNVAYELGLAHALGKDVFIFKQRDVRLAADFGGTHYYEYDRSRPEDIQPHLITELVKWADGNRVAGVAALAKPAPYTRP